MESNPILHPLDLQMVVDAAGIIFIGAGIITIAIFAYMIAALDQQKSRRRKVNLTSQPPAVKKRRGVSKKLKA